VDIQEAINKLCSYFGREIDDISRLEITKSDDDSHGSTANVSLYRKLLYVTMLDTLAGLRFERKAFPELSRQNQVRFSRFVIDHCSWSEAKLVSLPFLFEKLKEQNIEKNSLGQFVSEKMATFNTQEGDSVPASEMDEDASILLGRASNEKEEKAISQYRHTALLYRYRNRLIHESREPGYAMEDFADGAAPYCHSFVRDGKWYLGYPLDMFEQLARNGLAGFRRYLTANSIDPYSVLDDARRW
jgi:hypothetical protein